MDVDTAKEWASLDEHVAVVFFLDGAVASDWSYELIHAMTILVRFGAGFIYYLTLAPTPTLPPTRARARTLALTPALIRTPTRCRLHLHCRGQLQPEHRPALPGHDLPDARWVVSSPLPPLPLLRLPLSLPLVPPPPIRLPPPIQAPGCSWTCSRSRCRPARAADSTAAARAATWGAST